MQDLVFVNIALSSLKLTLNGTDFVYCLIVKILQYITAQVKQLLLRFDRSYLLLLLLCLLLLYRVALYKSPIIIPFRVLMRLEPPLKTSLGPPRELLATRLQLGVLPIATVNSSLGHHIFIFPVAPNATVGASLAHTPSFGRPTNLDGKAGSLYRLLVGSHGFLLLG